ncbi:MULTISPECIES: (deoxy)nucleoside triphosphate pyrophosphohydrolase [Bacillus cereus group]|uniref:(deoxy)nucleoside triphosphate pyrophosphohydrolase n=1 Tax=Bacillus cereus group TaxID=86661 RepID=UPI0007FB393D|nr:MULTISPECIES: (deoxy)nucleoside triphosphate pyrophosphohydrolase [Bacillus cereus group]MCP1399604.1 8-oxo-dGTP diphosphatase [Bacillus cereus]MEC2709561.1 (deoxy)nucleoside triphosphate pyrophosphohydrolase [Bacillus thuringiensis]MED2918702.1 (deoxy)nucleoside triphosphate pyrophosphohydrolase [Bacillus thuringiensis]MED2922817.1 (deoxy)nucleoside triphosphate pyrophosphohydrolase [Bacillus thuringiensis]MED3051175.1 (deoxy)nucleoside triphosphate pyrophosphohydrolase [Bacillus thuringie
MKRRISVVGAVIFNENNEVLCALRSPTMTLPNYWEFPGGKIKNGEEPQVALVREIKEELGCSITVDEKVEEIEYEYETIIVHLTTYKAQILEGIPKALEHTELKWVRVKDLNNLNWAPADIPTVESL